jgi:hypothetical protein
MQTYFILPVCPVCDSDLAGEPNNGIEYDHLRQACRLACPFCGFTSPWRSTEQETRDDVARVYHGETP